MVDTQYYAFVLQNCTMQGVNSYVNSGVRAVSIPAHSKRNVSQYCKVLPGGETEDGLRPRQSLGVWKVTVPCFNFSVNLELCLLKNYDLSIQKISLLTVTAYTRAAQAQSKPDSSPEEGSGHMSQASPRNYSQ